MIDLTGKVALVTGGSRGIGRACALRLAEAGADVALNYLTSQSAARETAEAIKALGRRAAVVRADVSELEDVQAMVEYVGQQFGRLDILVSNVASGGFRNLMDATPQHFTNAMSTNVLPLITLVQAAQPLLARAEGRAKVIGMSSHGSYKALPHYGLIGASKAALEAIIRHLALELGDHINFNVVLAGLVETDSTRAFPPEVFERNQKKMMMNGRRLTEAEVADAVLFLSSPLSDLVQAQTLIVDGGAGLQA